MKFGTLYAYWTSEWQGDFCALARKVAAAGLDVIEVGAGQLVDMSDAELAELKSVCKELNLEISANLGPPKDKDVSSADPTVRERGIKFLCDIMDQMDKIDCRVLIGAYFNCWPCEFKDLDKPAIWKRSVESLKRVAAYADKLNIDLCLEVLNRFETNLINTCDEGIKFCRDIGSPRAKLLLDTFHMNIEEDDIIEAFRKAGKANLLGHVHVGECNRKLPGMGRMDWVGIGKVLNEIGYDRFVVMEPFMKAGGKVGSDIKVWRDLSDGADEAKMDEMIKTSAAFLKKTFAKA